MQTNVFHQIWSANDKFYISKVFLCSAKYFSPNVASMRHKHRQGGESPRPNELAIPTTTVFHQILSANRKFRFPMFFCVQTNMFHQIWPAWAAEKARGESPRPNGYGNSDQHMQAGGAKTNPQILALQRFTFVQTDIFNHIPASSRSLTCKHCKVNARQCRQSN